MRKFLLLFSALILLSSMSLKAITTTYNSENIINMSTTLNGNYSLQLGNKMQQSFKMDMADKKATKVTVKYFFLDIVSWVGPDSTQLTINIYEGTIGNLGTLVHTQPYSKDFGGRVESEANFKLPSTGSPQPFIIRGTPLVLEKGKNYVFEIVAPSNFSYPTYAVATTDYANGSSNLGTRDIWLKFYGAVESTADMNIKVSDASAANFYLDKYSDQFTSKLLNTFEPENLYVTSTKAGSLTYVSTNPTIVGVKVNSHTNGVKDNIEVFGFAPGKSTVYILQGTDSISYFNVTVTDKKKIKVSYQYIKYPTESNHAILTAYAGIAARIKEIYNPANILVDFVDQGVITYEWDLNGDGSSYTADRMERELAAKQAPNPTNFFSNLCSYRVDKNDATAAGTNGGGTSIGMGAADNPPRYAHIALHLFRTIESIGETLAHELAHNLGLLHYSSATYIRPEIPNEWNNIMKTGRDSNYIYSAQWDVMHNTIDAIKTRGEDWDNRATATISNFSDRSDVVGGVGFKLAATTTSNSSIVYKLTSAATNFISVDNAGNVTILGPGVAEVMACVHGTDTYKSYSKRINITVNSIVTELNTNSNIKLAIYPNPVSSTLNIQVPIDYNIKKVQVLDITGKILIEQTANTQKIDVQSLAKGVYVLNIVSDKKSDRIKFSKE